MESLAPAFSPSLSRFVEEVSVIAPAAGSARVLELLPDGRTTLIYRLTDHGRAADVTIAGPLTRAKLKTVTGLVRAVVVQFKPGWSAPVLGVSAHALTDRYVLLQDLWGRAADDLRDELFAARTTPEVIERLARALAARAGQSFESASARLARRAVRLFDDGELRVASVAERLGVTSRHLHRAFTASIGVGPKQFARTVRLQRAVRMAATSTDWVRIAAAAGYYDQAHLIADFRDLVGVTPGAFAKRARRSPR